MSQMRVILPLLKARITERSANYFIIAFGAEYGSPTTIRIALDTSKYDLRDGDLLTLYTEVLIASKEQTNVKGND